MHNVLCLMPNVFPYSLMQRRQPASKVKGVNKEKLPQVYQEKHLSLFCNVKLSINSVVYFESARLDRHVGLLKFPCHEIFDPFFSLISTICKSVSAKSKKNLKNCLSRWSYVFEG